MRSKEYEIRYTHIYVLDNEITYYIITKMIVHTSIDVVLHVH